jgi:hypothetical protein
MLEVGYEPDYSEPDCGGLPEVEAGLTMEIECGFLKAFERERTA